MIVLATPIATTKGWRRDRAIGSSRSGRLSAYVLKGLEIGNREQINIAFTGNTLLIIPLVPIALSLAGVSVG